jgi:hypothetical protein
MQTRSDTESDRFDFHCASTTLSTLTPEQLIEALEPMVARQGVVGELDLIEALTQLMRGPLRIVADHDTQQRQRRLGVRLAQAGCVWHRPDSATL